MTISKVCNHISKVCVGIKQDFYDLCVNDVDKCIKDIAFMKFWGMTTIIGGCYFLWTATDLLSVASTQGFDIALVSTCVAVGILSITAGHDVYKIANNRQIEKESNAIREMIRVGHQREKMNQAFSSGSSELEKAADEGYKGYKKVVLNGTWSPFPSLWLKIFPLKNG